MKSLSLHCRVVLGVLAAIASAAFTGCPTASSPTASGARSVKPEPLVLLVADDPRLSEAIAREWRGRTEEELTVRNVSLAEIDAANRLPGDVVIFPTGFVGQLAEREMIVPLEASTLEDSDFNYRDIFDQIRLRELRWGGQTVGVPLGSPQLLLAYRADIFSKLGLTPPVDWAEYQQLMERLADRAAVGDLASPADQPWRASVEPLAAGWAGQLLLARAAAYAMHRDQVSPLFRFDSMAPLIDQPPYVRALEELVVAAKAAGFTDQRLTPAEGFAEICAGRCAMAITWPPPVVGNSSASERETRVRFAILPGASQAYRFATKTWENRGKDEMSQVPLLAIAGRMAAVSSSSADPKRAAGFVVWLASREVSQQVGPYSPATTLFRNSQIAQSERWTGSLSPESSRQYADVLAAALTTPQAFPGLRLPGRSGYLSALDEAVGEAFNKPAAAALADAAQRWDALTHALGTDGQRRANAHSLGQSDY